MTTHCPHCQQWSALPADGGKGDAPHVLCQHCDAILYVEARYTLCRECSRYHRSDYDDCPFCTVNGVSLLVGVQEGQLGKYTLEPKKRRAKRGNDYYWQLYLDYKDQTPAPPPAMEEPPQPAPANGKTNGTGQGNGYNGVGSNGHAGNGHSNGNGYAVLVESNNGPSDQASQDSKPKTQNSTDLAIADTSPQSLFSEEEEHRTRSNTATSAPVTVSAGNYNEFEYELIQDPSRLAEVAELLARETIVGVDTETTGLDPHTSELLLLQVSTADKVYIVDCRRLMPLALKPLLENTKIKKLAQNAKFEYEMLRQQTGISLAGIYDTMLAERLLTAGISREISLKMIAHKYIGATLDKSVREAFYKLAGNGDSYLADEQLHYAARDAFIMLPIWRAQHPKLKEERLEQVAELEFQCIAAVGDMELAGVQIDEVRWRKIISDVQIQRDRAAAELTELLAPATMQATMFGVSAINLNSNTQLVEALSKLGVDLPDTMEATLSKFSHPAVTKLLEYRGVEKTIAAFGESVLSLINPKTHRIHPDFNQYGADTGRFSCISGETLISTTEGLKRIDAVQVGDFVQTSFGPREVRAAWCNGNRQLLRVTLSDGRTLRLTPDHRVLTGDGDIWQPVENLSVGDAMFLSLRAPELDLTESPPILDIDAGAYWAKRKATIPDRLSVPLCELGGLITADGTFGEDTSHRVVRGKRGIRFTRARYDRVLIDCGWEDSDLIEKVIRYGAELFGIPFVEMRHKSARRLQLASTQVSNSLANLGLAGTAHTKEVPDVILGAPAVFQAAYLRGLFEGDGHVTKAGDHIGLTSVNLRLLESVQSMLSFLGCNASIRKRNDTSGFSGSSRYELFLVGIENVGRFMSVVGFMSSRKNSRTIRTGRRSEGSVTPIRISGAKLYKEAISAGLIIGSRTTVKPFIPYYKNNLSNTATLDRLLTRWGDLPEMEQAKTYRQRELHCVHIVSIESDGAGPVYDLTIDGVSEFLANGLVVHNCTKPNVQQIPATSDFRKCFVAAPGYKLVTCDYSQCIARDTWVGTEGGWVRIQDHLQSISKGISETLRLSTDRKYNLECTPDHRILTHRGWVEASSLREGDWVALAGAKVVEPEPFDELSWLMGFWVGDGSLNRSPGSVYFAKGQEPHSSELRMFIGDTLGEEPRCSGDSYAVTNQRAFADRLRGLFNKKDLRLPLDRLYNLGSFLSGLFDADGNVDRNGVYLATKWRGLAKDVQLALLRYGVMSTLITCRGGRNFIQGGALYYRVMVSDNISLHNFAAHIGFRLTAKADGLASTMDTKSNRDQGNYLPVPVEEVRAIGLPYKRYVFNHIHGRPYTRNKLSTIEDPAIQHYARYHWDRVLSVQPSGRAVEVFDVMDQPEQRFEAGGFIVHNCELRVLAELSGDPGFVDAFQSGGDLHSLTASQMFGVPLEEVQKPQRNAAKAINFGLAYGMGPGGLAPRLGVTLDDSKELISRYFKAYPGVQKWLDKAAKDAVRLGYSATTLGRKRYYNIPDESLKRLSEDDWRKQIAAIERQGKNSPIQGCVSGSTHIFEQSSGYVTIESMCGRAVSVWDGKQFSNATVVYSGKKQLVRVTLRGGHYIECSPDHKFLVACNDGYKWVWEWKPASEIRAQNRVALTDAVGEWHLPLDIALPTPGASWNANAASVTQLTDPTELGEWLGRVASDGSLAQGAVSLLVAEHEEAILAQLQASTATLGHVGHSIRSTVASPQRLHKLTLSSRGLVRQLREMGIKERIPAFVWRDSTLLSSYLRGLFDGDGTVHPDGALLTFGQGDKHLAWAREVQEALLLFGIRSRINSYTNKHYRINLRVLKRDMPLFCERVGFINPAKREKATQIKAADRWERVSPQYGMAMLVESIEVTDEYVDMYDVVNSDTGQFMANGMVVHNCNADMTKIALIYLRTALKGYDARTVNTVHDEIVVEAREDQAEEVMHLVESAMVRAGQVILKVVPIVAEASVADYWSK